MFYTDRQMASHSDVETNVHRFSEKRLQDNTQNQGRRRNRRRTKLKACTPHLMWRWIKCVMKGLH